MGLYELVKVIFLTILMLAAIVLLIFVLCGCMYGSFVFAKTVIASIRQPKEHEPTSTSTTLPTSTPTTPPTPTTPTIQPTPTGKNIWEEAWQKNIHKKNTWDKPVRSEAHKYALCDFVRIGTFNLTLVPVKNPEEAGFPKNTLYIQGVRRVYGEQRNDSEVKIITNIRRFRGVMMSDIYPGPVYYDGYLYALSGSDYRMEEVLISASDEEVHCD